MKNIFFRVNASVDIGIGHVMRCLALAKSLSINGINCIFLINEDHGGSYELISLEGFEIYFISQTDTINRSINAYVEHDLCETINILQNYNNRFCFIVDHYELDHLWEQSISKYVDNIVVIDDLMNRQHYCDLIVDSSFQRESSDYKDLVPTKAKILTGSQYVLLRNENQTTCIQEIIVIDFIDFLIVIY